MASPDNDIRWHDVDERYAQRRSESVEFSDVLYGFDCPECAQTVTSGDCDMDPDGPTWSFRCDDCDLRFRMSVDTVVIDEYPAE